MTSFYPFNTLIQVIAALLIFAVGYFVLLISAIGCLLLAVLLFKGARALFSCSRRNLPVGTRNPNAVLDDCRLVVRDTIPTSRPVGS
jgi:hypothetical protein